MPRTCPPTFAMEITQPLREYAAEMGLDEDQAVPAGLLEKSGEFKDSGGEVYRAP